MIASITAKLKRPTNWAAYQAMMARYSTSGSWRLGIGPFIGPPWPDSMETGA
jgi:hypothetical protein